MSFKMQGTSRRKMKCSVLSIVGSFVLEMNVIDIARGIFKQNLNLGLYYNSVSVSGQVYWQYLE